MNTSKGLSVAALVLGIVGLVLCAVPMLGFLLGVIALIFGIIGIRRQPAKGMAITGIVTGSVAILIGFIVSSIMLFSFMALPSLQQSQRDTERKNDVAQAATEIANYESNYRGQLPEVAWLQDLKYSEITDITDSGSPSTNTAVYTVGKSCEGASSSHAYSVTVKLEKGGQYCQGS